MIKFHWNSLFVSFPISFLPSNYYEVGDTVVCVSSPLNRTFSVLHGPFDQPLMGPNWDQLFLCDCFFLVFLLFHQTKQYWAKIQNRQLKRLNKQTAKTPRLSEFLTGSLFSRCNWNVTIACVQNLFLDLRVHKSAQTRWEKVSCDILALMEKTVIPLSPEIVTAKGGKTTPDNTEAKFSVKFHYITESQKRNLRERRKYDIEGWLKNKDANLPECWWKSVAELTEEEDDVDGWSE